MIRLHHAVPAGADELTVEGEKHHYLVHVLRAEVDDELEVFDGEGHAWSARVVELHPDRARLRLGPAREQQRLRTLTLVQGVPKGDKFEWVLQKCTELGASRFLPAFTARTVVKLSADKAEDRARRWRKIVEEAARQSGRADVPEVSAPCPLGSALDRLSEGAVVFVLDEEERSSSLRAAFEREALGNAREVALVIGPEGGLDRAEVSELLARGAIPVTLGARVLRTETAPIVALTVALLLDGALG